MKTVCPLWALMQALLLVCACSGVAPEEVGPPPAPLEGEEPLDLKTAAAVPVQGQTGPGGTPFEVLRRSVFMDQYPCGSCHTRALTPPPPAEASARWGHTDIRLAHAPDMQCATCHDYADPQRLQTASGKPVDFDHSYAVCGTCHFQQERDWAGGAHGKRLAAWRGRRVVYNCSQCHDPHAPAIAPQMPVMPTGGPDRPR